LRDALAGFFHGNAAAAIQRCQPFLHGLAEFQFVNGVNQGGVRRQFFRHVEENFFGTHAFNAKPIPFSAPECNFKFKSTILPKIGNLVTGLGKYSGIANLALQAGLAHNFGLETFAGQNFAPEIQKNSVRSSRWDFGKLQEFGGRLSAGSNLWFSPSVARWNFPN